ncbi:MAG: Asp-tRNA(Asn)/Glu-tRNA(Gln) amidotransferase subunit GatB [Candidatus Woesearchaeota archaeon]|jgi:aspartyl-tRNA(Asn)/glutamyl-tRNA(Gln) amidotransferase subunit B
MVEGVKIGLEIHGYLNMKDTKEKLFCRCKIDESQNDTPNTNICPRCTGQPGNKPNTPNKEAVDKIIKCALMLGCRINHNLLFQRKHYSYPDSPNNYQKTMSGSYATPVGEQGEFLKIRITECHLEEDPARYDVKTGTIDYNRCGYPLIEIVTEPDFRTSDEVRVWLRRLMTTLSYIDGVYENMGVKCDVNVSIKGHPRVETKNVNSRAAICEAIEHELKRQQKLVDSNEAPDYMQTRGWDDSTKSTWFMRKKETATQYMFIPEPDLPVVQVDDNYIEHLKKHLPMRPEEKVKLYVSKGLTEEQAIDMSAEIVLSEIFDDFLLHHDAKLSLDVLSRFKGALGELNYEISEIIHNPHFKNHKKELKEIAEAYSQKHLHNQHIRDYARQLAECIINTKDSEHSAKEFISKNKLSTDTGELDKWVSDAITENPKQVEDIKKGNDKMINFLVGQVMKKSGGKANPGIVKGKIEEKLK